MATTVKVSTRSGASRRVELYDHLLDGRPGYCLVCRQDEFPHPRAGIARRWETTGPVCGPSDKPMQWWRAV